MHKRSTRQICMSVQLLRYMYKLTFMRKYGVTSTQIFSFPSGGTPEQCKLFFGS